ncbi:recombinase family protein [Alicyclobacillus suci]|uniref:recombinase family protein n=1 Tax=Alicyclobacillus suci TaxID=2816080 RepID=UPI001A8D5E95|nr:recombinase family protein [Alicyclobacillus suci]
MIALYERVSTDEQAQSGFSLDAQKERLEAYCKSQGWSDFEHFTDDGYSGTNMNRPALQRLLRYIDRRQVDTVVVYKLDRLGRKQKDVLYLLEDVFDKHGVAFKSVTEPFDTSTPLGRAMLGILAVFGQLERDTIIERTKSGLRQRARRGLWPSASFPFGYKMNDAGVLEIVPSEAEIVREVFRRFIRGDSRKSIAEWMQKRVPNQYVDHYYILNMIRRRTYLGQIVMRKDIFEGQHEAIIDEETFTAAQRELQARTGQRQRRSAGVYLLSKMMTCGECGAWVYYFKSKQKLANGTSAHYLRVQCKNKKASPALCKTHSFLARDIEALVVRQAREIKVEPMEMALDHDFHHDAILNELESALEKVKGQQNNLLDAVEAGAIPLSVVKERLERLNHERQAIFEQMGDIQRQCAAQVDTTGFSQVAQKINDLWDDMTADEQREAIRLLIKNVRVYADKHIEIVWNV